MRGMRRYEVGVCGDYTRTGHVTADRVRVGSGMKDTGACIPVFYLTIIEQTGQEFSIHCNQQLYAQS